MRTSTRAPVVLVLLLLASCASSGPGRGTGGSPPDFALENIDGDWVKLSDHLGDDVVLINFWATWCGPCKGELPHLQRLYEDYADDGFVVLAVAMDGPESIADVVPMAHRYGLTFPVLLDADTRVVGMLNPSRAAPYNLLIDRTGRIVSAKEGFSPGDELMLEQKLRNLL